MGEEGCRQFEMQSRLDLGQGLVVEYGFGEDIEARIRLLYAVRALENVEWIRVVPVSPEADGAEPLSATALDHVQMTALCRIIVPHVPDQRAVWLSAARVIAQQSLLAGCNGIGSVLLPAESDATEWNRQRVALERDLKDIGIQLTNARDPQWTRRSRRGRLLRPRPT